MNFILISPHFPSNFKPFAYALKRKGVNVFGIGDAPFDELGIELQEALTEYYLVSDLENTVEVKRAVAFYITSTEKLIGLNRITNIGWS